jgi:hypothetical protein
MKTIVEYVHSQTTRVRERQREGVTIMCHEQDPRQEAAKHAAQARAKAAEESRSGQKQFGRYLMRSSTK